MRCWIGASCTHFPCFLHLQLHNPLPFQVKTDQETLTNQIPLEDTRLHKYSYLLEKMIWLRGCSDHPFLYQKELSSALVGAGQLLGNWGRKETLEHPLWSTKNKRVRRKNYIYTKVHRNSCLWWTKPQHNTQTRNSQNLCQKKKDSGIYIVCKQIVWTWVQVKDF